MRDDGRTRKIGTAHKTRETMMRDFGKLLDTIDGNMFMLWRLIVAEIVLIGIMGYGFRSGSGSSMLLVAIAAFLAFLIVKTVKSVKNTRVELFETGMVIRDRDGENAIAYGDIGNLNWEKHTQTYMGIIPTGSFTICMIEDKQGNVIAKLYSQHLAKLAGKMEMVETKLAALKRSA